MSDAYFILFIVAHGPGITSTGSCVQATNNNKTKTIIIVSHNLEISKFVKKALDPNPYPAVTVG